jgi:hypothetical protein
MSDGPGMMRGMFSFPDLAAASGTVQRLRIVQAVAALPVDIAGVVPWLAQVSADDAAEPEVRLAALVHLVRRAAADRPLQPLAGSSVR